MKPRFPLRTKILLLAIANLALLGLILLVFVRLQLHSEFESFLMATAREKIFAVSRELALDLSQTDPADRNRLLERYSQIHGVRFLLFGPGGDQLAGPPIELPDEVGERLRRPRPLGRMIPPPGARPPIPSGTIPTPPPFLVAAGERYWVGLRIPLLDHNNPGHWMGRGSLLLVSPTLLSNPFFFELKPWLAILAVAVLASLICWMPLVRSLTRTISEMTAATAAVAEGQFDVEVKTKRQDELGSLSNSINRMTSRLKSYVQGQKRFLGDIAHELRSPLGRMQVALGIMEERAPAEEQNYIRDLKEEVEFMSDLTTELLTFARAEMRPESLKLAPVNVRQIAERAADVEGDTAQIQLSIDPSIDALGDTNCVFRALSNLIRNAVRYAGAAGPITVSAERKSNQVHITVADSGPGVPPEALDKIFAPFYRLEASRDRKKGGTGLGLAIVRSCVEACGGTVASRNRDPHGLEVTITLQTA